VVEQAHALRVVGRSGMLAWRRLPLSQLPSGIRRRVTRQVVSGRDHLIHSVITPIAQGNAAIVRYAMVLGGHSLNVHAALPAHTPADSTVELVLSDGSRRLTVPGRLSSPVGSHSTVTVTALLGTQVGGIAVTPGRWSLTLLVTSPGVPAQELRLIGTGDTPVLGNPSTALSACRVSGLRMRTGLGPTGRLRLIVAEPVERVEIVRVGRQFAGLRMEFRPVGDGRLEATDSHRVVALPTEPLPGTDLLSCRIPLADLQAFDQGHTWAFRWVPVNGSTSWLRRNPDDLRGLRPGQNSGVPLMIVDRRGRLHTVTQRHTIRGTYQLSFAPAPGPAAPAQPSISTASTGSLK
jgi:hypothetical protein